MHKVSRPAFVVADSLFACVFAASLLAISVTLMISGTRIMYRAEQKLEMERMRYELLIELPSGLADIEETLAERGFAINEVHRNASFVQWQLLKEGIGHMTEAHIFVAP